VLKRNHRKKKRKRRADKELEFEESKKSMNLHKSFISNSTENETCNQGKASTSTSTLTALLSEFDADDRHDVEEELGSQSDFTEDDDDNKTPQTAMINLSDPALWPKISDRKVIDHLILHGPKKVQLRHCRQDENGRHFSDSHYFRKLANNEFIPRRWLMYSETADRLFCFYCLRFDRGSRTSLASDGFNDWVHLSPALKSHESGNSHMKFYQE
jgi:hypothetical protein